MSAALVACLLLTGCAVNPTPLESAWAPTWQTARASAYGAPSVWDGGYWHDGRWRGYWGRPTAWGAHCDPTPARNRRTWATFGEESWGVAHRTLPLGTWIELRVPTPDGRREVLRLPVIDRGPYPHGWERGTDWSFDLAEPVVWWLGWMHAGPPRYEASSGSVFGVQDIQWRVIDWPRDCPAAASG